MADIKADWERVTSGDDEPFFELHDLLRERLPQATWIEISDYGIRLLEEAIGVTVEDHSALDALISCLVAHARDCAFGEVADALGIGQADLLSAMDARSDVD